ncbi:MAG: diacylglycerol kinase family protein [Acidobacteriota bacterium]
MGQLPKPSVRAMRIMVLINAAARKKLSLSDVNAAFQAAGVEAEINRLEGKRIASAARAAVAAGVDAVVAGGGDGTINTVAGVLVHGQIPLGVLPLGTLNHFAKDLGIPLDFEEAVRVVAQSNVRRIDVGQVNNHIFLNNSSIGLYPRIVKRREEIRERLGRGKWLAMLTASITVFRRFPLMRVRLVVDGQGWSEPRTTPFVFIGNNEYQMHLFALGSRDYLDKGRLSLYVPNRTGRFGLLWLALLALVNQLEQTKDFDLCQAQEIWIDTRKRALRISLDGEVTRIQPPLYYRSLAGALPVLAPEIAV